MHVVSQTMHLLLRSGSPRGYLAYWLWNPLLWYIYFRLTSDSFNGILNPAREGLASGTVNSMYINIYIYIYREREIERERDSAKMLTWFSLYIYYPGKSELLWKIWKLKILWAVNWQRSLIMCDHVSYWRHSHVTTRYTGPSDVQNKFYKYLSCCCMNMVHTKYLKTHGAKHGLSA